MRNKKKLAVAQLDHKMAVFKDATEVLMPQKGWINSIRTTLNMTREQLGHKLGMTKGAIQKIEEREATGQLSINKLKSVAEALDAQFVYGFVPKEGSFATYINTKAENMARKIVLRTHQNMKLENQAVGEEKIKASIIELADEIKRDLNKSLWD